MKRKYQLVIVLNLQGNKGSPDDILVSENGGSLDDILSGISKELEGAGATLEQIDRIGRKDFAYENHAKQKHGYYVNFLFEADPSAIESIRTRLALNKDIQLQHFQTQ